MKPIKTIEDWCEFGEYRAYLLWAIARRKHNEELTNSTEIIHRRVPKDEEDIEDCYNQLKALANLHDYTWRIYLTVNARNTLDAYSTFSNRLNNWALGLIREDEGIPPKLKKVSSYWKSELHKSQSKDDSYFVFDLDDVSWNEMQLFRDELEMEDNAKVVISQGTPNGYHIVTTPFNHTEFDPGIEYDEMDTDGQLFIEEIDNR